MTNNIEQLLGEGRWEAVLEAYGTPGNFADDSHLELIAPEIGRGGVCLRVIVAEGYAKRAELMTKQKEETEKRRGLPRRWANDGSSCFLCDNVGQAKDIGDNVLLLYDTYTNLVLLPNRYAAMRGHCLVVEKEHQRGEEGKDKQCLELDLSFFANSIELAEKYDVCLLRNPPQAGMSIPGHDHFHAYPNTEDSVPLMGISHGKKPKTTDFGEEIYRLESTAFDTLAFAGKRALETIIKVIRKMETNQVIFTLHHDNGYFYDDWDYFRSFFYLTPHAQQVKGVGGQAAYIAVVSPEQRKTLTYEGFVKEALAGICPKGTFNWQDYF